MHLAPNVVIRDPNRAGAYDLRTLGSNGRKLLDFSSVHCQHGKPLKVPRFRAISDGVFRSLCRNRSRIFRLIYLGRFKVRHHQRQSALGLAKHQPSKPNFCSQNPYNAGIQTRFFLKRLFKVLPASDPNLRAPANNHRQ